MLEPVGMTGDVGAFVAQPTVSVANSAASTATTTPALRVFLLDLVALIACVLSLASILVKMMLIPVPRPQRRFRRDRQIDLRRPRLGV
jgi:hypothetical protein